MIKTVEKDGLICIVAFKNRAPEGMKKQLRDDGFRYHWPTYAWRGKAKYYEKYRRIFFDEQRKKQKNGNKNLPPTLCGDCFHADKGDHSQCPWAREFKPVDGWDAIPTKVLWYRKGDRDNSRRVEEQSYCVLHCPMFKRG